MGSIVLIDFEPVSRWVLWFGPVLHRPPHDQSSRARHLNARLALVFGENDLGKPHLRRLATCPRRVFGLLGDHFKLNSIQHWERIITVLQTDSSLPCTSILRAKNPGFMMAHPQPSCVWRLAASSASLQSSLGAGPSRLRLPAVLLPRQRFTRLASTTTSTTTSTSTSPRPRPLKLAIIGSGPSAFYAASRILQLAPLDSPFGSKVEIHMYERLPTPYGLVRYGVAPDHPEVKVST
jgi:hypothetical protein